MKKVLFSLVFVALSAMTFAQQWTGISKSSPTSPQVTLISSSEKQVVVDFSLGGFNLTEVSTPNGPQQIVSVPKMASMLEAGAPDLPQFPVPAIIGDRAEMESRANSPTTKTSRLLPQRVTSAVRSTPKVYLTPMVKCTAKTLSIRLHRPILKRPTSSVTSAVRTSW